MYDNMNFDEFWDDNEISKKDYICDLLTDEMVKDVEAELGYKLPKSYIYLMKLHNGGLVQKDSCSCDGPTSRADDHIAISGIMGIGKDKPHSLCGSLGSQFMIDEWEYPAIGVAICDCPSAGHDMVFLDYRECGPTGEPCVVYVDQESDYKITKLADSFEEFITKLSVIDEECDIGENLGLISGKMEVTEELLAVLKEIKGE